MTRHLIIFMFTAAVLCSCGTARNTAYLQDMRHDSLGMAVTPHEITLQAYDKISIVVGSRNARLSALFNLPVVTEGIGSRDSIGGRGISMYTVDKQGNIDFPVAGSLHVAGLTRDSVAKMIKRRLADDCLLADGVVTVEFANLSVAVLGEVNRPGIFSITRDCITIFDAIGMAGDITRHGDRRKVTVTRNENGIQKMYTINLLSAKDALASPAYYLRQNDMVYVSAK